MPNLPRVIITDFITDPSYERHVLDGAAEVVCLNAARTAELAGRLGDADVIICFHAIELTAALIAEATRCRGIVRGGVGYNNIDLKAAGERGIVVCNVPDYGTEEVADHAIGLLLVLARRIVPAVESIRRGEWFTGINIGTPRLRGQTLGIIGCGRIGTATALRAKALGMRVVIFDPYVSRGHEKAIGVERVWSLDELLPQSQFVSLHCPMTDETRWMLDARRLAQLSRGAYLINTARGGLVDESALVDALDSGQLESAALDVVEREPLDFDRLRRHPKVLITPHCAFYSDVSAPEARTKAAEEARRIIRSEPTRNPVNLQFLSKSN